LGTLTDSSISLLDDLRESKNTISELTRRLHEYELEIRRLENEREELTAAYKEAEAVRTILQYPVTLPPISSSFRAAKLKRSAPKPWPPNSEPSATKPNVASPSRKKKSKLFGEYLKQPLEAVNKPFNCFMRFT
jgi:hypothetical protein